MLKVDAKHILLGAHSLAIATAGCAVPGAYTSIRHVGENNYLITGTNLSGHSARRDSTLLRCVIRGTAASCAAAAMD